MTAALSIKHTTEGLSAPDFPFVIFSEALGETKMKITPAKYQCGRRG